jgi:hypothetical protein
VDRRVRDGERTGIVVVLVIVLTLLAVAYLRLDDRVAHLEDRVQRLELRTTTP